MKKFTKLNESILEDLSDFLLDLNDSGFKSSVTECISVAQGALLHKIVAKNRDHNNLVQAYASEIKSGKASVKEVYLILVEEYIKVVQSDIRVESNDFLDYTELHKSNYEFQKKYASLLGRLNSVFSNVLCGDSKTLFNKRSKVIICSN